MREDRVLRRREFIGSLAGGALALPAVSLARGVSNASVVRGHVWEAGIRGMPDVIVSDGLTCVRTNAKGAYELPARKEARFISITVPSGYAANWRFMALADAPGGPSFSIWKDPTTGGEGCRFVQISDSEIYSVSPDSVDWVKRVRKVASESNAAFVIHTGDICRRTGLLAHQRLMNEVTMERPVFYCIGNHDLVQGPTAEYLFENLYGPVWYSFEAGNVHFCVTPIPYGDYSPSYTSDEVADWLKNDLSLVPKDMPVVVFNHMLSNEKAPIGEVGFTFGNKRKIDLRKLCNFVGYFYGHQHTNRFVRIGQTAFVCTGCPEKGGIDQTPEGIRVVTIDGKGGVSSELRYGHRRWQASSGCGEAAWVQQLDAPVFFAGPLVAAGLVVVGTTDEEGKGTGGVTALNAETGSVVWKRSVPGSVRCRLRLIRDRVIVQTTHGAVLAIRLVDGKVLWKRNEDVVHPFRNLSSGIAVDLDLNCVFVGSGQTFAALAAEDGRVLWSDGNWPGRRQKAIGSPGCGCGIVVTAVNWSSVCANDERTGELRWRLTDEPFRFGGATPTVADGKVLFLGKTKFCELDARTGSVIRQVEIGCNLQTATQVVCSDDLYLFGTTQRGLLALSRKDLRVCWCGDVGESLSTFAPYSRSPERCVGTTPVIVGKETVSAAASDGTIRFWRLDDGREMRCFSSGIPFMADVAISGRYAYAADMAGIVRAFRI